MMKISNIIVALCVSALSLAGYRAAAAVQMADESLDYQIVFHWGVIWKHAGDATLSLKKTSKGYDAMLVGATRSWADKLHSVRDTLKCALNADLKPVKYQKLTHEDNYHARDIVDFKRDASGATSATCARYRKGKPTAKIELSTPGEAYDMLSVFYMLRTLDFDAMHAGSTVKTVIFSGKEKEQLTIRYVTRKQVELRDKTRREAHHLKFSFTQDNGKTSSDNIDAYISTDDTHIPLMLVGKLKFGEVKCFYSPSKKK